MLPHYPGDPFLYTFHIGQNNRVPVYWVLFCFLFEGFIFIWFLTFWKAQSGYPQSCRAFSMCKSSNWDQRLASVEKCSHYTQFMFNRVTWVEVRHWSVWVGFLHICIFTAPLSFLIISKSKKGNLPSDSISYVNLMLPYQHWLTTHLVITMRSVGRPLQFWTENSTKLLDWSKKRYIFGNRKGRRSLN